MTETSYTAWDDKLYEWPPPEGWYEASDGKWWPEGYGPAAEAASAESDDATGGETGGAERGSAETLETGSGATAGVGADASGPSAWTPTSGAAGSGSSTLGTAGGAFDRSEATSEVAEALNAVEAPGAASQAMSAGRVEADAADRAVDEVSSSLGEAVGRSVDGLGSDGLGSDGLGSGSGLDSGSLDLSPSEAADIAGVAREAAEAGAGGDAFAARTADLTTVDASDITTVGDEIAAARDRADIAGVAKEAAEAGLFDRARDAAGDVTGGAANAVSAGADRLGGSLGGATDAFADLAPDPSSDLPVDLAPEGDDVGAALAETLAVRSDAGTGPASDDPTGLAGSAPGLDDLPVASVVDAATDGGPAASPISDPAADPTAAMSAPGDAAETMIDSARGRLDDVLGGTRSGLDAIGDRANAAFDRAPEGVEGLDDLAPPGSAADAATDLFGSDDRPGLDVEAPAGSSRVDLDALPPPLFDPPTSSPSALAGPDDATILDRAPDGGSGRPSGGTLFPDAPGSGPTGPSTSLGDPGDLRREAEETMAIPGSDAFGDPAGDVPSAFGAAPGGLGAETGPLAGPAGEAAAAAAAAGGFGVPGPGGPGAVPPPAETGAWSSEPVPQPAAGPIGAGATTGNWNQADYGAPGGGGLGLDPADLGRSRQGVSGGFVKIALGVLALVALGVVAFLLLSGDDDEGTAVVDQTGPGSFAAPHLRSTGVEVFYPLGDGEQRWVVEVLEPVRDASAEAAGGAPASGQALAATSVRVRNQNATATATLSQLQFNAVTADGQVITRDGGGCPELAGALDGATTLPAAGVAEGVICWEVAAVELPGLLLGIESTEVDGRIHISLQ